MSAQHPRDLLIIQEIKIITPHTNRACIYFFHIITTATDVTTFVNFYLETEQIVANFSIPFSAFCGIVERDEILIMIGELNCGREFYLELRNLEIFYCPRFCVLSEDIL